MNDINEALFWEVAEAFLTEGAERSTMMGNVCLRVDGDFFASLDRRTGNLIVKLAADRVDQLIESGEAVDFAPNGRRFKEWASLQGRDLEHWSTLMDEARRFACEA